MASYYIDQKRGNDSTGDGSIGSPWQNLEKIDDAAKSAGDIIYLADDSVWRPAITSRVVPPTSWAGTESNPVRITKYTPTGSLGTTKPTVIWHHNTATTDWEETATPNVWLYSNPGSYLFTNSCLIRLGDTWNASCVDTQTSAALIGASGISGRYFATSTNLWLYSVGNPVTTFGSVKVSPGASGYFTFSTNRNWVVIEDIHFKETGCGILFYSGGAGVSSYRARRISGETVSNLIAANADAGGFLRAWIHDCTITDFGALAILSAGAGGFQQVEIYNNTISDGIRCWAQGAIYLTCRTTGFGARVYNNRISKCRWGTRDKSLDGSAIYTESGSNGAIIYRNYIEDCYCAFQDNSGRANTFIANIVNKCRIGMRISDQSNNNAMDHKSYHNTFIVGYDTQSPAEFGSDQGMLYPGFWIYRPSGTVVVTATNNIIAKVGNGRGLAAFGKPDAAGTFNFDGNWIYNFENDVLVASTNGTPTSVSKLGTTNPAFDTKYMPTNSALRAVGSYLGYADFYGTSYKNLPSAGAVEYVATRSIVSRTVRRR